MHKVGLGPLTHKIKTIKLLEPDTEDVEVTKNPRYHCKTRANGVLHRLKLGRPSVKVKKSPDTNISIADERRDIL
jgi:hypothetical protein